MVFGSNMIEAAGSGLDVTFKLCHAIFRGEHVPDSIEERDPEYEEHKRDLLRKNIPINMAAVLQSRREIIQHAKAATYIINQVCIEGKDLSEEIILHTHSILTNGVDADDTPWTEYSGVYRNVDVRAGLHQFPDPSLVPTQMRQLVRNLEQDLRDAQDTREIDPFALAAKYCHLFVNIHPFIDGNGRTCRLILNALLLKLGGPIVCIGEDGVDRVEYLNIAARASALEASFHDDDDDDNEHKPKAYRELASFTLARARASFRKLLDSIKGE